MGGNFSTSFLAAVFNPSRVNVACRAWLLDCKSVKALKDFISFAAAMQKQMYKCGRRGAARRFRHWRLVAKNLLAMGGDFLNTAYSAAEFANCNCPPANKILVQGDLKSKNYTVYKIGVRGEK